MISPERLRYYKFFSGLNDAQIKEIAMIADQEIHEGGRILFRKGMLAESLYFLEEGCVDLFYHTDGTPSAEFPDGIPVAEITPGEPFSISALIEPYVLTATALTSKPSRLIKIDAKELRALFRKDKRLAFLLTEKASRVVIERLQSTRIQLASILA
jgi:CRP-like cAMP-binding protein